jgi:excisionase family DNA binding protein
MQMISAEQLAERLSVPKITVYTWARRGQLPYYKMGRTVRFDEEEIEAWIRRRYIPTKMRPGGAADEN